MKKLFITSLILIISGCAGTAFKWSDARKIKEGMTTQEVNSLMGSPNNVKLVGNITREVWVYVNTLTGTTRTVVVDFENDKVIKAPPIPETYQD